MATIKSNYIGKQPLSETDYWIAKVFFPKSKFAFNPNGTWPLTAPARPNVPDRSYLMYIRGGFLLAGGILFTAWRLYIRASLGRKRGSPWGLDDLFIVFALMWYIAWAVLDMQIARAGCFGVHYLDCRYETLANTGKYAQISSICLWPFFALVKISILFFYRRLGFFSRRFYPSIIYSTMFLTASWGLIGIFMFAFRCTPTVAGYSAVWRGQHPTGSKCFAPGKLTTGMSYGHIATDAVIIAIPLSVIWRLQMAFWTKARLSVLFCVAFISITASIIRIFPRGETDTTWQGVNSRVTVWGAVDAVTALMVANLPALNMLFSSKDHHFHLHPKLQPLWHSLSSTFNRSKSNQGRTSDQGSEKSSQRRGSDSESTNKGKAAAHTKEEEVV